MGLQKTRLTTRRDFVWNREQLAWAAGFFDGEGCFGLHRVTSRTRCCTLQVTCSINQKFREPLDRWQNVIGGGGNIYEYQKGANRNMFMWRTGSFEQSQFVCCLLWPWLSSVKKHQASRMFQKYIRREKP